MVNFLTLSEYISLCCNILLVSLSTSETSIEDENTRAPKNSFNDSYSSLLYSKKNKYRVRL
jgi:hypothetical protein